MHPRISEAITFLDSSRAALTDAYAAAPREVLTTRPAPERWSVAQVLAHLAAVEGRLGALVASKIDEARKAGLGPATDDAPIEPTMNIAALLDRERKLMASEVVQPPDDADADEAWAKLEARRQRLKRTIVEADGLALEQVVAPHPVFGPLNAYQWLFFIGGHETRHTAQIRECVALVTERS